MNARLIALRVLQQFVETQASLNEILTREEVTDRFARELCFGVIRYYNQVCALADRLIQKPFKKNDQDIYLLIVLGIYQLVYSTKPQHAIVTETVALAQTVDKPWAKAVINACLRRFLREREALITAIEKQDVNKYAHPRWLLSQLKNDWSQQWQAIASANNNKAPLTLRVNLSLITREDYQKLLNEMDIASTCGVHSDAALILAQSVNVETLPGYQEGLFSVQDQAAQLAAGLLQLAPGIRVLDACAAPGGKTTHLFATCPELQQLLAIESDPARCHRLQQNLTRLRTTATVLQADAADKSWWDGQFFDRILCDVPCSATGVIRRHPDIKWLRRDTDIAELNRQQRAILENCWHMLKPQGLLLYATCSLLRAENQNIIHDFVEHHADVKIMPLPESWGQPAKYGRQILPGTDEMDGFYYCLLAKTLS